MDQKETKRTIPCPPEEYYYKLDNMVLSASQYVRSIFKKRWKEETGEQWVDEKNYIQKFIIGFGEKAFNHAQPFQKKSLNKSSSLNDWDISLLSVVIRNFGDESNYANENLALRQLKDLRNELAHNTNKTFTETQYEEHVKTFKDTLLCLGCCESDIDQMVEKAGVTSSIKAYERVKNLFKEAEKFITNGNFKEAFDRYSEAIITPSLLPINLGETFERRANCYLKSVKSEVADGDHCDQALLDVQHALEYNSSSWNANYLAAQCYRRKNKLTEALRYYALALALSPAQKQVKRDWDTCKVLAGVSKWDHLNPQMLPMNLEERVANFNNETGMKISKEQFIMDHRDVAGMVIKGQDHVFRGHQYYNGWDVEQSFTQAVKYFAKSDKVGNPEGSYNFAMCYHYGRGVKADMERALEIYRRVAKMNRHTLGQYTSLRCNVGVAASQHAIGLCYDYGIGVEQDHREAASWYHKAMENGWGSAANNLGLLYSKGQGVKLDEQMAEMCWKQGVNLKDVNAADSLVGYYIRNMETDLAEEWIKIGRNLGSDILCRMSNEEFHITLENLKLARKDLTPMVAKFEVQYNLETKGLTFKQRLTRAENHLDPWTTKVSNVYESSVIGETISLNYNGEDWGGKVQSLTPEKMQVLHQKAPGSIIANQIIQTVRICSRLNRLLVSDNKHNKEFKMKLLNMLYDCFTLESQFIFINSSESDQKLKSVVAELFEKNCEKKGEADMQSRYCYIVFNLRYSIRKPDDIYAHEIIKEGVHRYPENPHYRVILLMSLKCKNLYEKAVISAKEALVSIPDNVELLYELAVNLLNCKNRDTLETVSAYEKFLNIATTDHRKVPEAYYGISMVYFLQYKNGKNKEIIDKVKLYMRRGKRAEKYQLPCYLPYGESSVTTIIKGFLEKIDEIENGVRKVSLPTKPFVQPKSVLERKPYLKSPVRKDLILQHRQNLKETKNYNELKKTNTIQPKLTQAVAKKLSTFKPITLQEMNPTEDKIFDNRLLELTIIDDPNPYFSSIHLVAEDENGDTTRLYIYNVKRDIETMDRFQAGCRIAIINPYMRVSALHSSNGIRNDEIKCIMDLEKVKKMCRLCGDRNSILICIKCKRLYCSPECLDIDLELFDHKLICSIKNKVK